MVLGPDNESLHSFCSINLESFYLHFVAPLTDKKKKPLAIKNSDFVLSTIDIFYEANKMVEPKVVERGTHGCSSD